MNITDGLLSADQFLSFQSAKSCLWLLAACLKFLVKFSILHVFELKD